VLTKEQIKQLADVHYRRDNPDGKFDSAGRWYPEVLYGCCRDIRSPSRSYPYSYLTHCRTLKHLAIQYEIPIKELKRNVEYFKLLNYENI